MTDVEPYQPSEETLAQQVYRAERRAGAVRLRTCGASIPQIAQKLKYGSVSEASADIIAYLDELVRIDATEMVARQQAVIMDMMRAAYANASAGDTASIKVVKELMDHQAKLFGLHAPTRHQISAEDRDFGQNAAGLLEDLGVNMVVEIPPTIDAEEPWA